MSIVTELAEGKLVERMVENISSQSLTADLKDLCQMVYLVLLEYDEEKVVELYEHNELRFFIARVILNQYRSKNSPFYSQIKKFAQRSTELLDYEDEN